MFMQSIVLLLSIMSAACGSVLRQELSHEEVIGPAEMVQLRQRLRPPFTAEPGGGLVIDVPPTEEGRAPFPVNTILITGRTSFTISLRWHEGSDVEDGIRLRRRETTGAWQDIASWGPLTGFNDVTDFRVAPDRLYCYQFVSFNEFGESFSPQRCAFTRGLEDRPVFRARARFTTADVTNAGTDDRVTVRLNSPPSIYTPASNVTVLDYGRDDFERGSDFFYDLELNSLEDLTDVTIFSISKNGSDGWCIAAIELWINTRRVYGEEFGNTAQTCLWLDNEDGHSRMYTVSHERLRNHTDWQAYVQTFPLAFDRDEIESRVEGMVGHLIAADDLRVHWGEKNGRAWVEASRRSAETVHFDLDLEGDAIGFDPEVDIDFDVTFRFTERNSQWELDITSGNLQANVDFDLFTETLSFILPCGPIVSVVMDKGIPDCISAVEKYIEDKIRQAWRPIAKNFVAGDPCPAGQRPTVTVTEFADVVFGCTENTKPPPEIDDFDILKLSTTANL